MSEPGPKSGPDSLRMSLCWSSNRYGFGGTGGGAGRPLPWGDPVPLDDGGEVFLSSQPTAAARNGSRSKLKMSRFITNPWK
jgi:hypothetical protein